MNTLTADNVKLDRCPRCLGIFFDNFEFKKFDEPHEAQGHVIFQEDHSAQKKVDLSQRLQCPKCVNITMMRRFSSVKRKVEIDECAGCGGIWVDPGEMSQVRGEFVNEAEKIAATERMFGEMFAAEMAKEGVAKHSTNRVAAAATFLFAPKGFKRRAGW